MNAPHDLSPDSVAWINTHITLATARAIAPIRAELLQVDNWANGIYLALQDLVSELLRERPYLGADLAQRWEHAADRFDALEAGGEPDDESESLELLEARKMMFRLFSLLKLWPQDRGGRADDLPPRRAA